MLLAQRITEMEKGLLEKTDKLAAFHESKGNGNYTDEDIETINKLNAEIRRDETLLTALRESERTMAKGSDDGGRTIVQPRGQGERLDLHRHAAAAVQRRGKKAFAARSVLPRRRPDGRRAKFNASRFSEVTRLVYGEDEATKAVVEWQTKAASAPAMTSVVGWAAELVQQIVVDFMATLYPKAIYPRFSALGLSLSFGRNGKIIIPTRSRTPTIAGSFVGEGLPIPVRQGAFTFADFAPEKNGGHHDMDAGN